MKRFRMGEQMGVEMDSTNLASLLMLLSRGTLATEEAGHPYELQQPGRVFPCKTCDRSFPSFQALGGHRASHKKPRLAPPRPPPARPRVHRCPVCGVEFPLGQALGGHMRRHRAAAAAVAAFRHAVDVVEQKTVAAVAATAAEVGRSGKLCLELDLNMSPPPEEEIDFMGLNLGLGLSMVDCSH